MYSGNSCLGFLSFNLVSQCEIKAVINTDNQFYWDGFALLSDLMKIFYIIDAYCISLWCSRDCMQVFPGVIQTFLEVVYICCKRKQQQKQNQKKKDNSCVAYKAFIRWCLLGHMWFHGQRIITSNTEHPGNFQEYHQRLLVFHIYHHHHQVVLIAETWEAFSNCFFFYQQTPFSFMRSKTFLTEIFDPGHWPIRFLCPTSGEACFWPTFGFICLTSHPPCCITWFPLLYICVAHIIHFSFRDCYPVTSLGRITFLQGLTSLVLLSQTCTSSVLLL